MALPRQTAGGYDLARSSRTRVSADGLRVESAVASTRDGKPVRVHVIDVADGGDADALEAARGLIARYRFLDHPALWPVLEMEETEASLVVVTPLGDGVRLDRLRKLLASDQTEMSDAAVWFVGWQLFGALAAAHMARNESGLLIPLVHGALSMSHMYVTPEGDLIVHGFCPDLEPPIDEPAFENDERSTSIVPQAWWAPEVRQGHTARPPSDIYSAALIMRTLLTGLPQPIPGEPILPLVDERPDLPSDITAALDHAIARDDDGPAATAAELALRFEGLVRVSDGKRALSELMELLVAIRGLFSVAAPEPWDDDAPISERMDNEIFFAGPLLEALPFDREEASPESLRTLDDAATEIVAEMDGLLLELGDDGADEGNVDPEASMAIPLRPAARLRIGRTAPPPLPSESWLEAGDALPGDAAEGEVEAESSEAESNEAGSSEAESSEAESSDFEPSEAESIGGDHQGTSASVDSALGGLADEEELRQSDPVGEHDEASKDDLSDPGDGGSDADHDGELDEDDDDEPVVRRYVRRDDGDDAEDASPAPRKHREGGRSSSGHRAGDDVDVRASMESVARDLEGARARRDSAAPIELSRLASPVLTDGDELDELDATLDDTQPDLSRPSSQPSPFLMPNTILRRAQRELEAKHEGGPRVEVVGHFEVQGDADDDGIAELVADQAPRKRRQRSLQEARRRRETALEEREDAPSLPPSSRAPAPAAEGSEASRWGVFFAVAIAAGLAAWYGSQASDPSVSREPAASRESIVPPAASSATPSQLPPRASQPPVEPSGATPAVTSTNEPALAPIPVVSGETPEGDLMSYEGYLTIQSSVDAIVFLKGVAVGHTNTKNLVRCGPQKHVRLRRVAPEGASPWLTAGSSIAVPCRATTTHRIEPDPSP